MAKMTSDLSLQRLGIGAIALGLLGTCITLPAQAQTPSQSQMMQDGQMPSQTVPMQRDQLQQDQLQQDQWQRDQMQREQLQTGQMSTHPVVFRSALRLVDSGTRMSNANAGGRYNFTIEVPENAGVPLEAVVITPRERSRPVNFILGESRVFSGQGGGGFFARSRTELPLASIGGTPDNPDEVRLVFDEPVQPGNTVTVSLQAMKNPHLGGVQLYGVTAYPAGENGVGQFLGYGRIHTYNDVSSD